jgi:predicted secreted protein
MTIPSHGTLLKVGDGATPTEVFTTIAKIKDIGGPTFNRGTHDASTQTTDWGEIVPGLKMGGQVTFDINLIPTEGTHDENTGLLKDFIDGTKRNFQLVFPDTGNTTWQFAAYVLNYEPDAPVDGLLTASLTVEITGDPAPQFGV